MLMRKTTLLMLMVASLIACGKRGSKNNEKLAQTYFKMAYMEFSDQTDVVNSHKRALERIDQALLCDEKPEYCACKATILFKLGQFQESQRCFQRAKELSPEPALLAEVINNQACLFAQQGNSKEAITAWESLINNTAYQTPEVALVNMGKLHVTQNNLSDALKAFTQAHTLSPSYIDAYFYHAVVAHRLGDTSAARKALEVVLLLEPTHVGAHELAAMMHMPITQA